MKLRRKTTTLDFLNMKNNGEKITMLTAYDYYTAKALDLAGIDSILVGDSMGMVIYGEKSTLYVTIEDIIRHTQAVSKGSENTLIIADMPFMSFALPEDAVKNAGRLIKEGRADAVKIEGGKERIRSIELMLQSGIAVMGHIGLTPQYLNQFGGYKIQGTNAMAAEALLEDALLLEEAGVFAIVLEMIPWQIAKEISNHLSIPTIGIGAGAGCDGQILVSNDMMGLSDSKPYKFVKRYANIWDSMIVSMRQYIEDVKLVQFPQINNSFEIDSNEYNLFKTSILNNPKIMRFSNAKYTKNSKKDDKELGKIY